MLTPLALLEIATPLELLGRALIPSLLGPMRLPCTLLFSEPTSTPLSSLPEMRLRAAGEVPQMVLLDWLVIFIPLAALPCSPPVALLGRSSSSSYSFLC
jgi:hypothetical protein